jgi:glycosyltransferase involved in cell wall biosynthesis
VKREARSLFLGRLASKKRPELLIHAWAHAAISGGQLVIAGADGDITRRELEALAARLGVSDSVVFTGEVDASEKTWLYQNSATFVLPSENENFGLTIVEAMLGGCQIICSQEVATSRYVREADAGEVILMGEGPLSDALRVAADHPEDVRLAGQRAHLFAKSNLTWEPLAQFLVSQGASGRIRPPA